MARTITRSVTLIVAAGTLALAGCGGGEADDSARADDRGKAHDAAVEFARCMREQGVDVSDPGSDGGFLIGSAHGDAPDLDNPRFQEAEKKCRPKLEAGGASRVTEEDAAELQEQLAEFGKCMREQGVDVPDPVVRSAGSGAPTGAGEEPPASGGNVPDPDSPAFKRAEVACRDKLPAGLPAPGGE